MKFANDLLISQMLVDDLVVMDIPFSSDNAGMFKPARTRRC